MSDQPDQIAAKKSKTKARPFLLVLLLLLALVASGYAALSCQSVRRAVVGTADPNYKSSKSDAVRSKGAPAIHPRIVAQGFEQPTDLRIVPGHPDWLVVLEKGGTAKWHDFKSKKTATWFKTAVQTKSELGLLGIAFHPEFVDNGRFFVNENPKKGALRTRISEYAATPNDFSKPATFVRSLLEVEQPYQNHDGGQLLFGLDGFLYIGLGDGGWRADPERHGQNLSTLLGSMLRIDVDSKTPTTSYGIPSDNPFIGREKARPEIFAYGLRNPWRFTFADDGRLIVADVGQNKYEEVTIVQKGENHGWNIRESAHCFEPKTGCTTAGLTEPVFEYDHTVGQSITGGVVYRGSDLPSLTGRYLFADFVRGHLWSMRVPSPAETKNGIDPKLVTRIGTFPRLWSAFASRANGEVLIADFGSGDVVQLTAGVAPAAPSKP